MRDAAIDTHRSSARGAGRSRASGAPPLDDMVGEGPVSRGAPRRGGITSAAVAAQRLGGGRSPAAVARARRKPSLAAQVSARLPRIKPLKALTVAAFVVALVGIVANAMVFQRGHHPSPLFGLGQPIDGTADAPQRVVAAVPAPAQPVAVERTGTLPPAAPAAAPEPVAPAVVPAAKAVPLHHAAAKPKPVATGAAHPRPGAAHAKAEPVAAAKPAARSEVRAESKAAAKPSVKPAVASDPVAKLIAEPARPERAEARQASAAKAAVRPPVKAAAASPRPHHGPAATASADGVKRTAHTE